MTDNSDGLTSSHGIAKVAADRTSEAKAYSDYIKSSEFEAMNVFSSKIILGIDYIKIFK